MENKKRVATVHLNGIVESIVFDSLNRGKERMELYLSGDLVAVIPHGCFVKLFDYKCSTEAKSEDIVDEAIRHAESIRKEATDFGKFLKSKPYLMDDIDLAYEVFVGHIFEEVTNGGGNGARGNLITKDFEAYSAPNEHNMEKGDDEWYKHHMNYQRKAVESGEKVAFWKNPDGSCSSDTELSLGMGLIGYSDSGESDFIVVYGKYPTPVKGQYWYDFQKSINTNFSWYITNTLPVL